VVADDGRARTGTAISPAPASVLVPSVERTDTEGVDFGWVMQVTFITTLVVGVPAVALLSVWASLHYWSDRALFAIRVGAPIWFVTMILAYGYERRHAGE
jgi:hypothetical protein